jgi:hypothetical protein
MLFIIIKLFECWTASGHCGGTPTISVSPIMLLKTHVEKMSLFALAIMLLKLKDL